MLLSMPGSVAERMLNIAGLGCRFAGLVGQALMFGGAARMAALQVLINPGDFLCYRGQGCGSGDNPLAECLRAVELELQGLGPLRRCPGLYPLRRNMRRRVLQPGHPAIGLLLAGRQQATGAPPSLARAFLLAPDGRV